MRRFNTLKGSQRMGVRRIFLKPSAPLSLIKTYRMSLISAGSISLDSTFKGATSKSNVPECYYYYSIFA
jgi:hypothetical protein